MSLAAIPPQQIDRDLCTRTATIYRLTAVLLGRVASRPVIGRRSPRSKSTRTTDACGVGHGHRDTRQLLCFRCTQAITADIVIAYITHDDRPKISRHGSKRRGGP